MATDDPKGGKPEPGSRTTISGNRNSGFIVGRDLHGGAHLANVPAPPAETPAPMAEAPAAASGPIVRILFLGASPEDQQALRLDVEVREIDHALRQAEFRDRFELRQHLAVRPSDLQAALLRHRPHILQFSGHGSADGISLEDEAGQVRKIPGSVIARILAVFRNQIRCVVLNACYSRDQAEEIAKYIDCVVGMSSAIGDQAASSFSAAFYQTLAFGGSVETAFHLGCAQIDLDGLGEGSTPQLIALRKPADEIVFIEQGAG